MFKKFFYVVIAVILVIIVGLVYANVSRQHGVGGRIQDKYELKPGDRIVIIEAGYEKVYVRVTPSSKKIFDYKVPKGKVYNGMLILN